MGRAQKSPTILWLSSMEGPLRRKFSNHSFAEVEKMGGNEGQFRNRKRTTEGGRAEQLQGHRGSKVPEITSSNL